MVLRAGSTAGPLSGEEGVARRPLAAAGGRARAKQAGWGKKRLESTSAPFPPTCSPRGGAAAVPKLPALP